MSIVSGAGWGNVGDDSILIALVAEVRRILPRAEIEALTGPDLTGITTEATSVTFRPLASNRGRLAAARSVSKADVVLIGGGGLLQDILPRFYRPYFRAFLWGKLTRARVAIIGVGVYPPRTLRFKLALRAMARFSDAFHVRDPGSLSVLDGSGGPHHARVSADLAFAYPVGGVRMRARRSGVLRVCVSPRPWWHLPDLGAVSAGVYGEFLDAVAGGLQALANETGERIEILLMAMQRGTSDADLPVCRELEGRLGNVGSVRIETPTRPAQVVSLLSSSDLLIGMRLHSLILGSLVRIPTVAIAYDRKVREVMAQLGREDLVLDIENTSAAGLLGLARASLATPPRSVDAALPAAVRESIQVCIGRSGAGD